MTWRHFSPASVALTLLLLPALTGCVSVFQKKVPPPVNAIAPTPQPAPAPLYSAELMQTGTSLPPLPDAPPPNAQPAPPPKSEVVDTVKKPRPGRRTRGRKGETELTERETREKEARDRDTATNGGAPAAEGGSPAAENAQAKVTANTPTGETTAPTPIGQLTAGPTQDADGSRRQAASMIDATEHGLNGLRRNLSGDQTKTVAQIRSFLDQAQRALHNNDVDGAYTLATKAKLLLDELTGST